MYVRWLRIAVRIFFAVLTVVSPRAAGRVALRMFATPRRHHRPGWEKRIAGRGTRLRVGTNLAAHAWEAPARTRTAAAEPSTVLLVHGWEGRGTQLGHFVEPLVDAGFRVVAVDSPAHGDSSGTRTDLVECTEALRKVARELGPLAGVIAHSFGGPVTTLALERGLDARSVVLVGSPSSVDDVITRFGELTGVRGAAMRAFRDGMEKQTGVRLKDVEIFERVSQLTVPALIVHDRDDGEVPFHDAERLAARWPGATLVATKGLGHRRILKDPEVIRRAVEFIERCAGMRNEEPVSCGSSALPLRSAPSAGSAPSEGGTSCTG